MKINKQSWHYKLVNFVWGKTTDGVPTNICPYFWAVLFVPIALISFGIIMLAVFCLIVSAVFYPVFLMFADLHTAVEIFTCSLWASLMFVILQTNEVQNILPNSSTIFTPSESSFSKVTKAWLQAKHDKICPSIDFV